MFAWLLLMFAILCMDLHLLAAKFFVAFKVMQVEDNNNDWFDLFNNYGLLCISVKIVCLAMLSLAIAIIPVCMSSKRRDDPNVILNLVKLEKFPKKVKKVLKAVDVERPIRSHEG